MSSPPHMGLNKTQFYESIERAKETCTFPTFLNYENPLPGGSLTIHRIFEIAVGAAGIVNVLIAAYLIIGHLCNWCKPLEQKQQVRIITFLITLTATTFLSTVYYDINDTITPVGQLYEGIAISAVFLVYLQIIMPDLQAHDAFHRDLAENKNGTTRWFRILWSCVFQINIMRIITLLMFEILFGTTCPLSEAYQDGKTGITVVASISTGVAIGAVVMFERRMKKKYLQGHRSARKLWSFKIIIILEALQNLVFTILAEKKIWVPPAPYYVSYNDFLKGLPQVIFMLELFGAGVLFFWAYEWKKYRKEIRNGTPKAAGFWKALGECWNIMDIIYGSIYGLGGPKWMRNKALGVETMSRLPSKTSQGAKSSDEEQPWGPGMKSSGEERLWDHELQNSVYQQNPAHQQNSGYQQNSAYQQNYGYQQNSKQQQNPGYQQRW